MTKFFLAPLLVSQTVLADPPPNFRSVGPGGGGAFFAPSFSPFHPDELFVGSDMSDQFHTVDLGKHWAMTPFTEIQVGRNSPKVQFTSDPNVLYSIDFSGDVGKPVQSLDAGSHWSRLVNDPTNSDAWNIVADPGSVDRLFVSDYSDLWFSTDAGQSFKHMYSAAGGGGLLIAGSWFDGNFIVVATNDGLLVSNDGGSTISLVPTHGIPATEQMVSFAAAKSGLTTRFFCVTLGSNDVYNGVQGDDYFGYKGVYSLDWGASSWVKKTAGIPVGSYPFYVAMSRNNVDTAYVAGSNSGTPLVFKTGNGGNLWSDVLKTSGNVNIGTGWQGSGGDRDWGYAELCFGLAVSPNDADRVALTDYGFVHVTSNGGATWHQAYVDPADENPVGQSTPKGKPYHGVGLEDTTCWYVTWADADTLWASFADIRGARSTDGGSSWGFGYSGHSLNASYQATVHPTTGVMYMAVSSVHDMYESTHLTDASMDSGQGGVLYSMDKGKTWHSLGSPVNKPTLGLALDPTNPDRLYATVANSSVGGVYVCQNISAGSGATWTKLAIPPRTEGHAFNISVLNDGSIVATYSGRRTTNFTASSGVFYSTNAGASWSDRSAPGMLYWTRDITVDPFDSSQNTWYVGVYSGWGGQANGLGGLYRSTNRGTSWAKIATNDRIGSCTFDPSDSNSLYATTEVEGLLYSKNARSATPTFTQVASYPFRQPERVFFNPHKPSEMWVTSFGGGLRVGTVRHLGVRSAAP